MSETNTNTVNGKSKGSKGSKGSANGIGMAIKSEPQPSQETLQAAQLALANGQQTEQKQEESKDDNGTDDGSNGSRHHGPFTSKENALVSPARYGSKSKKAGEIMPLFCASIGVDAIETLLSKANASKDKTLAVWYFGMNSQHASHQFLDLIGGDVSQSGIGSGKGKALAAAAAKLAATEAELARYRKAANDAENATRSKRVLEYVQLFRTMPEAMREQGFAIISDDDIKQEVRKALQTV